MITLDSLPRRHYGAILADPPWRYVTWDKREAIPRVRSNGTNVSAAVHYSTMSIVDLMALQVGERAATDCSLFLWATWPNLLDAIRVIEAWGFEYKTCAFAWTKADATQVEMFQDDIEATMGMGYWTRANTEVCLLATRGRPKRLNADVRQAIIEPRREHSRKPEGVHARIERLVAGPYLELFARQRRPGWDCWGNETDKFAPSPEWHEMWSRPFDFSQEPKGYDSTIDQRDKLRAAIQRIDGINDNPADFNPEINEVCSSILRPSASATAPQNRCRESDST